MFYLDVWLRSAKRNIMLFRLYNHSSSSYSSTRGTFWDGYVIYVRIWKNEISILFKNVMMHYNTCFILMCDLDRQREILCCLDCMIIPQHRFIYERHILRRVCYLRANTKEWNLNPFKNVMMHSSTCFILMWDLDRRWEILYFSMS